MTVPSSPFRYFTPLEQEDFQRLEHSPLTKGLLRPFKGKGALDTWAGQCLALRDDLIRLATDRVLAQARAYPFHLLRVQLAQQTTGAGTTFLRWRSLDRAAMGVALWHELISEASTPVRLLDDLHALEQHRIMLNMQVSLIHSIARQAADCATKLAQAETTYLRRLNNPEVSHRSIPPKEAS